MKIKKLIAVLVISLASLMGVLSYRNNVSNTASTLGSNEGVKTVSTKEMPHPKEVVIKPLQEHGANEQPPIPSPSAQDIKLQALLDEIKELSDSEIRDQASNIKAQIHESNLIHRLNEDLVSEQEREDANKLLTRLALLGVEKAKRGLDAMKPELENALKKASINQ